MSQKWSFGSFFGRLFCNGNFKHRKSYKVDNFVGFLVFLNFRELLLAVIWSFLLSVVGNSGVVTLQGSKSIKIRQCNENSAIVDEWPLFRGAVIEGFHCNGKLEFGFLIIKWNFRFAQNLGFHKKIKQNLILLRNRKKVRILKDFEEFDIFKEFCRSTQKEIEYVQNFENVKMKSSIYY